MIPEPAEAWIVTTTRLGLRHLRADDAISLRDIVADDWVESTTAAPGERMLRYWAIVRLDTGATIGFCGFLVRPVKGTTMGYAILPEHRSQGFATEAAAATLTWAEDRGVDVYASVRPPNPASVRVLEKIGMRLVKSDHDEDGQRDIYRRQPGLNTTR